MHAKEEREREREDSAGECERKKTLKTGLQSLKTLKFPHRELSYYYISMYNTKQPHMSSLKVFFIVFPVFVLVRF